MFCKLALLACVFCTTVLGGERYCPAVINRYEWGAMCPISTERLETTTAVNVFVNHAVTSECTTQDACAVQVKAIQYDHMKKRGLPDISFNFLVGGDGSVFEGRSWGLRGAYNVNYNNNSIGISFLGTFIDTAPTDEAIASVRRLITCGIIIDELSFGYSLAGHAGIIGKITEI